MVLEILRGWYFINNWGLFDFILKCLEKQNKKRCRFVQTDKVYLGQSSGVEIKSYGFLGKITGMRSKGRDTREKAQDPGSSLNKIGFIVFSEMRSGFWTKTILRVDRGCFRVLIKYRKIVKIAKNQ